MTTTVFNENPRRADCILSEGKGHISREVGVLASGQNLNAGTVLQLTGAGKLTRFTAVNDSSGNLIKDAIGVLYDNVDASGGDVKNVVYVARLAEVQLAKITYPAESSHGNEKAHTLASLANLDIIAR